MGDIKTSTNPPKTKIFVGRLPENAQAQDLRRLFEQYGTVTECDILNRYGFVHMKTEEQAAHAIQNLNNVNFMGSNISVEASTGKKGSREGGPRRGGFGGRGGSRGGGYGPMRGGMGGGMGRPSPYSRPEPYGRPDYGRPEPYGRPDFERRAGGPGGPGPVGPSGPGPAAGGPGMAPMRNGYYDDRRAGDYMDRMDRGADYMDRSAGYMDRVDSYDRGYGDYASRGGPMTAREADRAGYSDMRQPYERRDMAARDLPPRDLAPPRMAYDMPPQTYERRDYLADRVGAPADRLGAAGDMYRRRTPPPPQATYGAGYERNGAGLDPYGPPARVGR